MVVEGQLETGATEPTTLGHEVSCLVPQKRVLLLDGGGLVSVKLYHLTCILRKRVGTTKKHLYNDWVPVYPFQTYSCYFYTC